MYCVYLCGVRRAAVRLSDPPGDSVIHRGDRRALQSDPTTQASEPAEIVTDVLPFEAAMADVFGQRV